MGKIRTLSKSAVRQRQIKKQWAIKVKEAKRMSSEEKVEVNGVEVATVDILGYAEKFKDHFKEVEKHFVEREQELEQIKFAMLTKEHVLLKGKTGTAKSRLGKYSFGHIKDAKVFAIQLSKFMSEEYLFGAIDIQKMRNEGKVEHRIEDSIVDCEFAFVDEVFDGNDALLRSLLEVLNERTWTRHTQHVTCRLHSAMLTSNYVREDEVTEAFLDRILFKSDVKPVTGSRNRMQMYRSYTAHGDRGYLHLAKKLEDKGMSYNELAIMADYVLSDAIELPERIIKLYDMIVREYCKQLNAYVSDRKANKMLNIIKASALLDGRTKVDFKDIESIKYALVVINNPQQEEVFRAVYTKLMTDNVKYESATTELDALTVVYKTLELSVGSKMNPKSKEILELNEEAQLFEQKLGQHPYCNGSGFNDVDTKFTEMRQGTEKIIREVQRTLKLNRP